MSPEPVPGSGWRFALRALEVRLRFVLAIGLAVACVAGWPWLQNLWDRARHRLSGQHAHGSVSGDVEYFCPMDPGVQSAWPAICPICHMDLVPRKKGDAQILPEGVVARMQFSPYRIQLAGLRTTPVELKPLSLDVTATGTLRTQTVRNSSGPPMLAFEALVSESDRPLLEGEVKAAVRPALGDGPVVNGTATVVEGSPPKVWVELENGADLPAGTAVTAVIRIPIGSSQVLAVPESAVIDRGQDRLVFVESMPGMFDAVPVRLGRRCGGDYPVLAGLQAGQKVVTNGAFLIDAETRLDPNLAVQYFGAGKQTAGSSPPAVPLSTKLTAKKLSAADQALADRQKLCPVTGLPLNSMGGPLPIKIDGRKIFLCCQGCESAIRKDPRKYLQKLDAAK